MIGAKVCLALACFFQYKCIMGRDWLCSSQNDPERATVLVWLFQTSTFSHEADHREIAAILLIMKFAMFQMSALFIMGANVVLNYDLLEILRSPYKRDSYKIEQFIGSLVAVFVTVNHLVIPSLYIWG